MTTKSTKTPGTEIKGAQPGQLPDDAAQAAQDAQYAADSQAEAQAALVQAQDEVLATVHPINGPAAEDLELGEAPSPAQVTEFADQADSAKAAEIRAGAAKVGIPTRATWKQHGNPLSGWEFFGTAVKTPTDKGTKVAKVEVDPQGVTLLARAGKLIERFGSATKFWALVPAEAPRKQEEPKAPKAERTVAEGRTSAADRLAAALTGDQAHAPAPEGYEIRWPKGGYDLLKRTDERRTASDGSPAWLVRCNQHQTTTPSTGGKAGDALGTKAGRLGWCSGCQADAKAEARAEAQAKVKAEREEAKAAQVKAQAEALAATKAEAAQDASAEHDSAVKSEG
jgi:hypothetical protein